MADYHNQQQQQHQGVVDRLKRRLNNYRQEHDTVARHQENTFAVYIENETRRTVAFKQRFLEAKNKKTTKKDNKKLDTSAPLANMGQLKQLPRPHEATPEETSEAPAKKPRLTGPHASAGGASAPAGHFSGAMNTFSSNNSSNPTTSNNKTNNPVATNGGPISNGPDISEFQMVQQLQSMKRTNSPIPGQSVPVQQPLSAAGPSNVSSNSTMQGCSSLPAGNIMEEVKKEEIDFQSDPLIDFDIDFDFAEFGINFDVQDMKDLKTDNNNMVPVDDLLVDGLDLFSDSNSGFGCLGVSNSDTTNAPSSNSSSAPNSHFMQSLAQESQQQVQLVNSGLHTQHSSTSTAQSTSFSPAVNSYSSTHPNLLGPKMRPMGSTGTGQVPSHSMGHGMGMTGPQGTDSPAATTLKNMAQVHQNQHLGPTGVPSRSQPFQEFSPSYNSMPVGTRPAAIMNQQTNGPMNSQNFNLSAGQAVSSQPASSSPLYNSSSNSMCNTRNMGQSGVPASPSPLTMCGSPLSEMEHIKKRQIMQQLKSDSLPTTSSVSGVVGNSPLTHQQKPSGQLQQKQPIQQQQSHSPQSNAGSGVTCTSSSAVASNSSDTNISPSSQHLTQTLVSNQSSMAQMPSAANGPNQSPVNIASVPPSLQVGSCSSANVIVNSQAHLDQQQLPAMQQQQQQMQQQMMQQQHQQQGPMMGSGGMGVLSGGMGGAMGVPGGPGFGRINSAMGSYQPGPSGMPGMGQYNMAMRSTIRPAYQRPNSISPGAQMVGAIGPEGKMSPEMYYSQMNQQYSGPMGPTQPPRYPSQMMGPGMMRTPMNPAQQHQMMMGQGHGSQIMVGQGPSGQMMMSQGQGQMMINQGGQMMVSQGPGQMMQRPPPPDYRHATTLMQQQSSHQQQMMGMGQGMGSPMVYPNMRAAGLRPGMAGGNMIPMNNGSASMSASTGALMGAGAAVGAGNSLPQQQSLPPSLPGIKPTIASLVTASGGSPLQSVNSNSTITTGTDTSCVSTTSVTVATATASVTTPATTCAAGSVPTVSSPPSTSSMSVSPATEMSSCPSISVSSSVASVSGSPMMNSMSVCPMGGATAGGMQSNMGVMSNTMGPMSANGRAALMQRNCQPNMMAAQSSRPEWNHMMIAQRGQPGMMMRPGGYPGHPQGQQGTMMGQSNPMMGMQRGPTQMMSMMGGMTAGGGMMGPGMGPTMSSMGCGSTMSNIGGGPTMPNMGGGPTMSAMGGGPTMSAMGGGPTMSGMGGGPTMSGMGGGPAMSGMGGGPAMSGMGGGPAMSGMGGGPPISNMGGGAAMSNMARMQHMVPGQARMGMQMSQAAGIGGAQITTPYPGQPNQMRPMGQMGPVGGPMQTGTLMGSTQMQGSMSMQSMTRSNQGVVGGLPSARSPANQLNGPSHPMSPANMGSIGGSSPANMGGMSGASPAMNVASPANMGAMGGGSPSTMGGHVGSPAGMQAIGGGATSRQAPSPATVGLNHPRSPATMLQHPRSPAAMSRPLSNPSTAANLMGEPGGGLSRGIPPSGLNSSSSGGNNSSNINNKMNSLGASSISASSPLTNAANSNGLLSQQQRPPSVGGRMSQPPTPNPPSTAPTPPHPASSATGGAGALSSNTLDQLENFFHPSDFASLLE